MKKYRKVSIRDPRLRAARKFLREIIIIETWWTYRDLESGKSNVSKSRMELLDKGEIPEDSMTIYERNYLKAKDEQERLRDSLRRSIVECFDCYKIDQDMVYLPDLGAWYCESCAKKHSVPVSWA